MKGDIIKLLNKNVFFLQGKSVVVQKATTDKISF